ncbi:hypothetical protein N9484_06890 [Polaribacter sp.]|nr:hypothetical protein [Polaribacter sp.]MDB4182243.1 hypothetical protein [Polaribacter sp.]
MQNDYAQLLLDVQKKSNITVNKSRDLRFVKEEIEQNSESGIGFNTLRRLFGFLEKTEPSISTLNILAVYLGFSSYSAYKNNIINYDGWYFQQNLQRIQSTNTVTNEDIETLNIGLLNAANTVYFAYFFSYFIERKNIKTLEEIVKKISYDSISESNRLKFATIVSLSLYRIDEKNAYNIYSRLVKYDSFRNNVPLLYIDYSNLHNKYSKILTIIKQQSKKEDDILFVELMRFYWKFYSSKDYLHIEIKKPDKFYTFHPVLQGRYYSYLLLKSEDRDSSIEKKIIFDCKKSIKKNSVYEISFLLEEIIPSLIFKRNFAFLNELVDSFYEEILEMDSWSSKTGHALSLIAMANLNIKKDNLTMAQINLNLVELEKVELSYSDYVSLFYFVAKLQITYLKNTKNDNKKTKLILENLIQKTKFTKFNQSLIDFTIS